MLVRVRATTVLVVTVLAWVVRRRMATRLVRVVREFSRIRVAVVAVTGVVGLLVRVRS